MNERVIQFRVGVMVLATFIITLILVILFGGQQAVFKPMSTYYIKFTDAPGVSRNTPIQMSGIVIGRVEKVDLAKDGGAVVTAKIYEERTIRKNQVCRISSSILGDAVLRFVRSNNPNLPETEVAPGETITGVVAPDPIQVVTDLQQRLVGAIGSVSKTSDDLDVVVQRFGSLLKNNEQRIDHIIAQSDETITLLRKSADGVNRIVGDPQMQERLRDSVEQMPPLLRDARDTVNRMNQTFALLDSNLKNLEGFTGPLGQRGEDLVNRFDVSLRKFDTVLTDIQQFTKDMNSQQGSLGQLVHNPDLYNNLNQAVSNVEEMTRQMRPILDDARVFSDKIARHPEVLGVRGALERRPGIK